MRKDYYGDHIKIDELARELKKALTLYREYQIDAANYDMATDGHITDEDLDEYRETIDEIDSIIKVIEKLMIAG